MEKTSEIKSTDSENIKKRSEYFMEGFNNFKSWIEGEKDKGLKGGELVMKNQGSGDASTTLYLGYENRSLAKGLNDFHPEGYDWYFQETKYKDTGGYSIGLSDELKDLLLEYNIQISKEQLK